MKKHDTTVHNRAVEHPCDSLGSLDPELENPVAHGSRVGHAKVRAEYLHAFRVANEARQESRRQCKNLGLHAIAIEGDGPGHRDSIAYPLYHFVRREVLLASNPCDTDAAYDRPERFLKEVP